MELSYVRIKNGKVIALMRCHDSLRCRQRNNCDSFKFISFREMEKVKKLDSDRVIGPIHYNTISKL